MITTLLLSLAPCPAQTAQHKAGKVPPPQPPAEEVTFRFAPPDGLHLVERLKENRRDRIGAAQPSVEVRESVSDVHFKRTGDGYTMTVILRELKLEHNGQRYADPKARVLIGRPIVYHISQTGELKDVEGYEGVKDGVRDFFPGTSGQHVAREAAPARLAVEARSEWNRRYEKFLGKTVKRGDRWEITDAEDPHVGPIRLDSLTRFPTVRKEDGRTLVTVDFQYATSASVPDPNAMHRDGRIPVFKVKGQRVVDPATMMIHSEDITLMAAAQRSETDDGRPINRVTTIVRKYEYEVQETAPAPPAAEKPATPQGQNAP